MGYTFTEFFYIWGFLCLYIGYTHNTPFILDIPITHPVFVNMYAFSGSFNSPGWLLETFVFQRGPYSSILRFLLCPQVLVCFSDGIPFKRYALTFRFGSVQRGSWSTGRGMGLALGTVGVLRDLREILEWIPLRGSWADFLLKSWAQSTETMPLFIFICFFPNISLAYGHGGPTYYSWCCWREIGFSNSILHNWCSWALKTALLFHHGIDHCGMQFNCDTLGDE